MPYSPEIQFAESVTPSDTADLPGVATYGAAHWVYVGGAAGDLSIRTAGGDLLFDNLEIGHWHRMPPFAGVNATNTTSTDIVAGY